MKDDLPGSSHLAYAPSGSGTVWGGCQGKNGHWLEKPGEQSLKKMATSAARCIGSQPRALDDPATGSASVAPRVAAGIRSDPRLDYCFATARARRITQEAISSADATMLNANAAITI